MDIQYYIIETFQDELLSFPFYFSIIRETKFTYLGWFCSITPISGIGIIFGMDGSFYKGELKNGKKNHFGSFYYDNGSHYDGNWRDNLKEGIGNVLAQSLALGDGYAGLTAKFSEWASWLNQNADAIGFSIQSVFIDIQAGFQTVWAAAKGVFDFIWNAVSKVA